MTKEEFFNLMMIEEDGRVDCHYIFEHTNQNCGECPYNKYCLTRNLEEYEIDAIILKEKQIHDNLKRW